MIFSCSLIIFGVKFGVKKHCGTRQTDSYRLPEIEGILSPEVGKCLK